jgi:hypothetical protein
VLVHWRHRWSFAVSSNQVAVGLCRSIPIDAGVWDSTFVQDKAMGDITDRSKIDCGLLQKQLFDGQLGRASLQLLLDKDGKRKREWTEKLNWRKEQHQKLQ